MQKYSGVTLVELLVALTVAGVLAAVAVPSLRGMYARRQVDAAVSALQADFGFARSEALKRGHSVTICRRSPGQAATPACASSPGSWHDGWLVFDDRNQDGARASDEPDLRRQGPLDGIAHIGAVTAGSTERFVRYRASGLAVGTAATFIVATDTRLVDTTQWPAGAPLSAGRRVLCLSQQGRLRLHPQAAIPTCS